MSFQPFPAHLFPTDTFRRQRHSVRQPPAGRLRGVAGPRTGRVRGVRLPQRQGLPLPRKEQLHLPEREQHLPLELTWRLCSNICSGPQRRMGTPLAGKDIGGQPPLFFYVVFLAFE